MKVEQRLWQKGRGWSPISASRRDRGGPSAASLVLFFAAPGLLDDGARFAELKALYPGARLIGCTTGGEIAALDVHDGTIVATAIEFASTAVKFAATKVALGKSSFTLGAELAAALPRAGLSNVFLLSDGTEVNGTELVAGVHSILGREICLTGGLAGDGANFRMTKVGLDANPEAGKIVALGFYGERIRIGYGSVGGWDAIGPARTITRAVGNMLFDLDGKPALDLYKHYLGAEAARLPASALLFPLRIYPKDRPEASLVRTVVGVDAAKNAMIFAGTIPEGHIAQVMIGNFDHLIAGAGNAARKAAIPDADLAILVSCIGRKLLLGQRIGDEVEAVAEVLGADCCTTGFYSYGEIAPMENLPICDLHNQTMTITTFAEL